MNPADFFLLNVGRSSVPSGPLRPLHVDGLTFRDDQNKIVKSRFVTGFNLFKHYAEGEQGLLEQFYGDVREINGNGVRAFSMWWNTNYGPHSVRDYYEKYEAALEHAFKSGVYVHPVMFCDQVSGSSVRLNAPQQWEHANQLRAIYRRHAGFVIPEISNEDWKNGEVAKQFTSDMFDGLMAMRSSWPETDPPTDPRYCGPVLKVATKHPDRTFDWPRKGKVLYEMQYEGLGQFPAFKVVSIAGEPERIGIGQSGNTTPRQHADNAAVCEMMGGGMCLHGGYASFDSDHDSDLQNCRMVGSTNAMACIQAVSDVWHSDIFDIECATTEALVRGTENNDGECPVVHWDRYNFDSPNNHPNDGATRTYFKKRGNQYFGLSVDPAPQWTGYQTRDARIEAQGGYQGNLIRCVR